MKKQKNTVDSRAFDYVLLSWKAPEYTHHEKSLIWYAAAALIVAGLVWYGIATDGWTFSVAVIVCAGVYYLFQRETPKIVDIVLSKAGVKIGSHKFPYTNIKGFWIVHEPPFLNKLYLRLHSKLHPDLTLSLDNANSHDIRKILKEYVRELEGKTEPFSDTLVRLFHL